MEPEFIQSGGSQTVGSRVSARELMNTHASVSQVLHRACSVSVKLNKMSPEWGATIFLNTRSSCGDNENFFFNFYLCCLKMYFYFKVKLNL